MKKIERKYATYYKCVRTDKQEETVNVEEIDNGFIVTYCKYDNEKYRELEKKKFYIKTNPLSEDDKDEDNAKSIIKGLDSIL